MKRYEAYKAVQPLWNMTFPKHWEVFPLYSIAGKEGYSYNMRKYYEFI